MQPVPQRKRQPAWRTARDTVGAEAMPYREQISSGTRSPDEAGEAKSRKQPKPKPRGSGLGFFDAGDEKKMWRSLSHRCRQVLL